MAKTTKKRTQTKTLAKKKKLAASDMKKVKGGLETNQSLQSQPGKGVAVGMLLPAVQKVRE